jgi:hypothetical protein
MLVPCHLPPQLIAKLTRHQVQDVEIDGWSWEAYSYESLVFFWRIISGDGTVEWRRDA